MVEEPSLRRHAVLAAELGEELRGEIAEPGDLELAAQLPEVGEVLDLSDRAAADDADLEPLHRSPSARRGRHAARRASHRPSPVRQLSTEHLRAADPGNPAASPRAGSPP